MRKWVEIIKTKKKIISYGEQILNNGRRLRWKTEVKRRWVHYGQSGYDYYVTYLCGKRIHHKNATFSNMPSHITCPRCIELLKKEGD